jgi:EmrB/QacA subfamily drug resistance transporter
MAQVIDKPIISKQVKETERSDRSVLIGLMIPLTLTVLNASMFSIAIPIIRTEYGIEADTAAWIITNYTLLYIISLPIYGRLGDAFGKRRLFLIGLGILLAGSLILVWAPNLPWLMVGKAIQGLGAASAVPLSMAIISDMFPAEKGEKMGTWSSIGPLAGVAGPFLAGFLIDYFGWRSLFVLVILLGIGAIPVMRARIPNTPDKADKSFLRQCDWIGIILLGGMISAILLYVSSRSVTGVAPLRDWRFGLVALILSASFIFWERRQKQPFINLKLFGGRNFCLASSTVAVRMLMMSGFVFLLPLYLTDVFDRSASAIGTIMAANAGALFITMRLGGRLADHWNCRWPVVIGCSIQAGSLAYFALLPESAGLPLIIGGLMLHGLGAGLSLAALHRTAMDETSPGEEGSTAGLYSTVQFSGSLLGSILAGVVLQSSMNPDSPSVEAYQFAFWFFAGAGAIAILLGATLKK